MELLFLGHSLLDFYPRDHIGNWKIRNVAKQGTIAKEGWKLLVEDPKILTNSNAVLVMYGINEIYYQMKEEMVMDYLERILQVIKAHRVDLPIILSSIIQTPETQRIKPAKIQRLNDQINQLAQDYGAYLLTWQAFYNSEGFIREEYTLDGIHLTAKGYQLFDQVLLQLLRVI